MPEHNPGGAATDTDDAVTAQAALAAAATNEAGNEMLRGRSSGPMPDTGEGREQPSGDTSEGRDGGKDLQAEVEKWRALARKHEQNAKGNADAARRLAEIEDAQKTETQRLNDQLAAAEVELATFRAEQIRADAGRKAGLDPELWEFITAAEPDEALKQAKRLAERTTPPAPAEPGRADLRQGARTPAQPAQSANDWIRQAVGRSRG